MTWVVIQTEATLVTSLVVPGNRPTSQHNLIINITFVHKLIHRVFTHNNNSHGPSISLTTLTNLFIAISDRTWSNASKKNTSTDVRWSSIVLATYLTWKISQIGDKIYLRNWKCLILYSVPSLWVLQFFQVDKHPFLWPAFLFFAYLQEPSFPLGTRGPEQ